MVRFLGPALVVLLSSTAVTQDFTDELIRLAELVDSKQVTEAIAGYERLAKAPASPLWLKAGSHYDLAELYGRTGDRQAAASALQKALELGFDDCDTALKSEHLASILSDAGLRTRVENVEITEPDHAELVWLKAEVGHAEHDARLMITENINRVDQQQTIVPQSAIPSRPTESQGVLYWRQQLRIMHAAQRMYVLKSDTERMTHAATMQAIGGGGGGSAMLESARQANARAEGRRLDIERRAFKLPPPGTARLRPCAR